jgi:hypothetical protein
MNDGATDFFFPLVAASAAALVGTLALLQTDAVSRRMLSEEANDTKRRKEYTYTWQTAIERIQLQLSYCLAGGIEEYKEDPEVVWKNMEYLHEDDDLNCLIERILDKQNFERFSIVNIDKDPHDPTDEWYLFLLKTDEGRDERVVYELPLMKFGMKLVKAFENRVTTTTLVRTLDKDDRLHRFARSRLIQDTRCVLFVGVCG